MKVFPMTEILMLCSANMCRSVMARAFLDRKLRSMGISALVTSAGLLRDGDPPPAGVIAAMAASGIDVGAHRSKAVTGSDLARADLVLAMSRQEVRHAAVISPAIWPRTFTLKEIVRRGERIRNRCSAGSLAEWLALVHVGRARIALLGDSAEDDIADPLGGPLQAYLDTADLIAHLAGRFAEMCWGLTSAAGCQ